MKKYLIVFSMLLTMASCIKINEENDNDEKDYVCDCTYISSNKEPEKNELTKFTNRTKADATFDCAKLEPKYIHQSYSGTCYIK